VTTQDNLLERMNARYFDEKTSRVLVKVSRRRRAAALMVSGGQAGELATICRGKSDL
jgi:hypothetical protein